MDCRLAQRLEHKLQMKFLLGVGFTQQVEKVNVGVRVWL